MYEDDYLLRTIQQLVAAIARIAGLHRAGEHDRALAEADQTWSGVLGIPPELAAMVDSRTLAGMLRDPERIRLAAQLVEAQARALAGRGDARGAAARSRRALELWLEARALAPSEDGDAAIRALLRVTPPEALAVRYRALVPEDG